MLDIFRGLMSIVLIVFLVQTRFRFESSEFAATRPLEMQLDAEQDLLLSGPLQAVHLIVVIRVFCD